MRLEELRCKNCGAALDPENVVERLAMARCPHCGSVFALEGLPSTPPPGGGAPGAERSRRRAPVPMPENIELEVLGSTLVIRRRRYRPAGSCGSRTGRCEASCRVELDRLWGQRPSARESPAIPSPDRLRGRRRRHATGRHARRLPAATP